jgi:protein phosphatase 1 regulatory subunit 11
MQRIQARQDTPTAGSQTVTGDETESRTQEQEEAVVLTLHVVPNQDERRVTWDEEVIDNENMGKKSSKGMSPYGYADIVCCIYHKPRAFGESSSDESSSSSSDDSDSDYEGPSRRNGHDHDHGEPYGDQPCPLHARKQRKENRKRKPSPNAYERMPNYEKKDVDKKETNGAAAT